MISIDLSGKTALITGATGQLGRVMAKTLAKAGADIILHYHKNEEKANALAEEIRLAFAALSYPVMWENSIRCTQCAIKLRHPFQCPILL